MRSGNGVFFRLQPRQDLVAATLTATPAIPVKIRYAGKEKAVELKAGQVYKVGAEL